MCPSSNKHIVWFILFRTDMSVREDTSWLIYTPIFPIFQYNYNKQKNIIHSPHFITVIFVRLFYKLSSSGSSDPYHFGGTRSVLSWETIVHYPRYKLRGQIRLKDTTLSLDSDLLSNYCLYCRFVFLHIICFCFPNEQNDDNIPLNPYHYEGNLILVDQKFHASLNQRVQLLLHHIEANHSHKYGIKQGSPCQ